MKFEDNLNNLEKLVTEMESGRLPLDEMMKKFDDGKKLAAVCDKELKEIRGRIEKVISGMNEPPKVEATDII